MDLQAIQEKNPRFVVGLMSGTSCDGVDAVLVRLKGSGENLVMKLIAHETYPYAASLRNQLLDAHMAARELCQLNFSLGERFAEAAIAMIEIAAEQDLAVDFISSHGHTVAHYPPMTNEKTGTMQIGEAAIIAERTGIPVVSDFRPRDMAAGGQGAPLVPYADWVLFRRLKEPVACLNIGGIANFTVVGPSLDEVFAFDTGPGNMTIDAAMRLLTKGAEEMDKDGQTAAGGSVISEFLDYLLDHRYFAKVPPKSTGREEFGSEVYLRDALSSRRDHSVEDLLATVTQAVATSIVNAFERFIAPDYKISNIIVSGGGAKNPLLLRLIQAGRPEAKVFNSEQYGIPDDAREAIAFAILGNETMNGRPANVPKATGATHKVILGKITPA
jgi:anhydro-N-acetylmuramic acid kinase